MFTRYRIIHRWLRLETIGNNTALPCKWRNAQIYPANGRPSDYNLIIALVIDCSVRRHWSVICRAWLKYQFLIIPIIYYKKSKPTPGFNTKQSRSRSLGRFVSLQNLQVFEVGTVTVYSDLHSCHTTLWSRHQISLETTYLCCVGASVCTI